MQLMPGVYAQTFEKVILEEKRDILEIIKNSSHSQLLHLKYGIPFELLIHYCNSTIQRYYHITVLYTLYCIQVSIPQVSGVKCSYLGGHYLI